MLITNYTIDSKVDIDNDGNERIITQSSINSTYFLGIRLWKVSSKINNTFTDNKIKLGNSGKSVGFLRGDKK